MTDDHCCRTTAESELPHRPIEHQRLWTPWRMRYISGDAKESGCLFCRRLADVDDTQSLIIHRGDTAFVILNLFPYNTGHVMIVPNEHTASPETARWESVEGMARLLPPTLRALRRVLSCDGFNVGFNIGDVAGAGVAEHVHQHVVPRWKGDANFMPILASTMVLPELLPVTYAKVRAELVRVLNAGSPDADTIALAILSSDGSRVALVERDSCVALPQAHATSSEPLWKAALREASQLGIDAEITGWAGTAQADHKARSAFALRSQDLTPTRSQVRFMPVEEAAAALCAPDEQAIIASARHLFEDALLKP